jgi:pimeloyl-ACP methyl ester carboxylesterase
MTDFVTVNNARLAYRLCGPANAPLIITLHGGRGMGIVSVLSAFVAITHSDQVITGQTSRHTVL